MTVNGIIAEYNPFHNGHLYHINQSKKMTGADYTVVVMSGNFTQRGEPAIIDKFTRAKMALNAGADLVIELPIPYATASAEHFAKGGVTLLDRLGVVTHLCFGTEEGQLDRLEKIAFALADESPEFSSKINELMKTGLSFPLARTEALRILYGPEYSDCLSHPNNILGIEYLKALSKAERTITPCTISRHQVGFHDTEGRDGIASASAIRAFLQNEKKSCEIEAYLPKENKSIWTDELAQNRLVYPEDFSEILYYKLLSERANGYQDYFDVSEELSNRIREHLYEYKNYRQFCELLDTRNFTYTRISRCLNHILLDIQTLPEISYARVLGFRKDAGPLLTAIKDNSSIPFVTKLANAEQLLSPPAYAALEKDIYRNDIYEGISAHKSLTSPRNEFTRQIILHFPT